MPSEHRLHPMSVVFNLGKQARTLVIPAILFLVGSGSAGAGWELLGLVFLAPYALVAFTRYITFRYRFEPGDLVVHSGLVFRNERHIPYSRIQNVEAVENPFHRMFGVVEVRLQTAGSQEPEATLSVLPLQALDEVRRRVMEGRAGTAVPGEEAPAASPVLQLGLREIMLSGFIENRGMLVVAAALGLLWEANVLPGLIERIVGTELSGRSGLRSVARAFHLVGGEDAGGGITLLWAAGALGVIVGFLLFTRVLSMAWAAVRLHGFRLALIGSDMRIEFGLLTRLTTAIPRRRIQQLTIRETPLHRVFRRASVRVATAGGTGEGDGNARQREWLAPIVRLEALPSFMAAVLPEVNLEALRWQPVHPRAFRRVLTASLALGVLFWLPLTGFLRQSSFVVLPVFLAVAAVRAHLYTRSLGWAIDDRSIAFRSGAFWRYLTVARFSKVQAVAVRESPLDRRAGMADLLADTAGRADAHRVAIPFLPRRQALELCDLVAARASRTEFKW